MYSDQVRDEVDGQEEVGDEEEEEEEDGEDTAMLGYWSNPEAEVSKGYRKCITLSLCTEDQPSL